MPGCIGTEVPTYRVPRAEAAEKPHAQPWGMTGTIRWGYYSFNSAMRGLLVNENATCFLLDSFASNSYSLFWRIIERRNADRAGPKRLFHREFERHIFCIMVELLRHCE